MSAQFADDRAPADVASLRIPPHAIDAEQAVLGGLMLEPASLPKVADWLSEQDFYRADHRMIYRAITTLIGRGSPVDPVTMGDWLQANGIAEMVGGPSYMLELSNATASTANLVAYAEIVVEKSRLRGAIDAGMKLTESAWQRGADSQQIIATAAHDLSQMQASKLRGGLEPAVVGMRRMQAELMERYKRGPALLGLPWPWPELNECTKGLRDGELYVIGGRPNMGKSILALQTALHVALAGERVALFSVEMTADQCMSRAVACVGQIAHNWVENPAQDDLDAEFWWSRLNDATSRIIQSPLLIDETPGLTVEQFTARSEREHLKKPIRLIVLDHMHDMEIDRTREMRHELGRIAQAGKTLAKKFKCPVVLLAQLNRAAANRADKRPTMTDLRESGEIEQKADVILFVHREDYYDPSTHLKGLVEVIVAKGRSIKTGGSIDLRNVFSEMRMESWDGPRPVPSESTYKPKPKRGFPA
ncbi:MAG: replicative DNA helicase [Rhodanobacter sp.]